MASTVWLSFGGTQRRWQSHLFTRIRRRLLVIKRLIEAGFRPGQVVANTADENLKIFADLNLSKSDVERSESTNDFISLSASPQSYKDWFEKKYLPLYRKAGLPD